MDDAEFGDTLRHRIEEASPRLGAGIGWRLLYSPLSTLSTASTAFIGLNPGGREEDEDHGVLEVASGSAYTDERWKGRPAGQQTLQRQVQMVFRELGEAPSDVLAGNLIPFRTPQAADLPDLPAALAFGTRMWVDILERSRVTTIVTMGRQVEDALADPLGAEDRRRVPLNWGPITGAVGAWRRGPFIGLPHLSRFGVMGRTQSAAAIQELFRG